MGCGWGNLDGYARESSQVGLEIGRIIRCLGLFEVGLVPGFGGQSVRSFAEIGNFWPFSMSDK